MSTKDEFTNEHDEWTPEERQLFAALPRERIPSHDLKTRTLKSVRTATVASAESRNPLARRLTLAGAAAGLFLAGTLVGYLAARRVARTTNEARAAKGDAVANSHDAAPNINQVRYVVWY